MQRTWRTFLPLLVLVALLAAYHFYTQRSAAPGAPATQGTAATSSSALPAFLPPEARHTLALIAAGGPFTLRHDGSVFGNYEHLLPEMPRGYYHEYTVSTPGAHDRGARRIITGGTPSAVYYYTGDHYRSFQRFTLPQ